MSEEIKETPTGELEQGEFKLKKKPKKLANKKPEETVKVDLSKKEETPKIEIKKDAVPESSTTKVDVRELPKDGGEVGKTHIEEPKASEEKKEDTSTTTSTIEQENDKTEAESDLSAISTKDFREFKVLDSKYINSAEVWGVFDNELKTFTEQRYNELKPLVLDQDIPTIQKHINARQLSYEELTKFYLYLLVHLQF